MKKSIILTLALLFATATQAQFWGKSVKGNGKISKETRTVGDYDEISCGGSFDYILVAGEEGKITLEGDENLLEYIITEVKGDKLVVKTEKGVNIKTGWKNTIKITIPFKDISAVSLAGSGDLWNEDKITATNFEASLAGSGDVVLTIEASSVEASIAGSGDLTLKGNTNDLEAKVAGSGDFHGFDLQSNNTVVSVAGSGDAEVVSKVSIKARVSGSGDIDYKGNPDKQDTKVSGSGSISKD